MVKPGHKQFAYRATGAVDRGTDISSACNSTLELQFSTDFGAATAQFAAQDGAFAIPIAICGPALFRASDAPAAPTRRRVKITDRLSYQLIPDCVPLKHIASCRRSGDYVSLADQFYSSAVNCPVTSDRPDGHDPSTEQKVMVAMLLASPATTADSLLGHPDIVTKLTTVLHHAGFSKEIKVQVSQFMHARGCLVAASAPAKLLLPPALPEYDLLLHPCSASYGGYSKPCNIYTHNVPIELLLHSDRSAPSTALDTSTSECMLNHYSSIGAASCVDLYPNGIIVRDHAIDTRLMEGGTLGVGRTVSSTELVGILDRVSSGTQPAAVTLLYNIEYVSGRTQLLTTTASIEDSTVLATEPCNRFCLLGGAWESKRFLSDPARAATGSAAQPSRAAAATATALPSESKLSSGDYFEGWPLRVSRLLPSANIALAHASRVGWQALQAVYSTPVAGLIVWCAAATLRSTMITYCNLHCAMERSVSCRLLTMTLRRTVARRCGHIAPAAGTMPRVLKNSALLRISLLSALCFCSATGVLDDDDKMHDAMNKLHSLMQTQLKLGKLFYRPEHSWEVFRQNFTVQLGMAIGSITMANDWAAWVFDHNFATDQNTVDHYAQTQKLNLAQMGRIGTIVNTILVHTEGCLSASQQAFCQRRHEQHKHFLLEVAANRAVQPNPVNAESNTLSCNPWIHELKLHLSGDTSQDVDRNLNKLLRSVDELSKVGVKDPSDLMGRVSEDFRSVNLSRKNASMTEYPESMLISMYVKSAVLKNAIYSDAHMRGVFGTAAEFEGLTMMQLASKMRQVYSTYTEATRNVSGNRRVAASLRTKPNLPRSRNQAGVAKPKQRKKPALALANLESQIHAVKTMVSNLDLVGSSAPKPRFMQKQLKKSKGKDAESHFTGAKRNKPKLSVNRAGSLHKKGSNGKMGKRGSNAQDSSQICQKRGCREANLAEHRVSECPRNINSHKCVRCDTCYNVGHTAQQCTIPTDKLQAARSRNIERFGALPHLASAVSFQSQAVTGNNIMAYPNQPCSHHDADRIDCNCCHCLNLDWCRHLRSASTMLGPNL